MSTAPQVSSNERISTFMKKSSTSIGILMIIYSIFLGTIFLIRAMAESSDVAHFDTPNIMVFCICAGLTLSGVLFLMGRKLALYLSILTFILVIIIHLIWKEMEVMDIISGMIIPILCIIGMIRSKVIRQLK